LKENDFSSSESAGQNEGLNVARNQQGEALSKGEEAWEHFKEKNTM
jgi:hypothetical protein